MEFIIVLGNSKHDVRVKRVKKAVEYYNQLVKIHLNPNFDDQSLYPARLIFSGKGNSIPGSSEAEAMLTIAVSDFHVPKEACIIENKSNNTRENFIETLRLLNEGGWFKPTNWCGKYIFTIVTSSFHAPRSLVTGLEILSQYGDIRIVHTEEEISKELEHRENCLLISYIKTIMLPVKSIHLNT